MLSSIGSVGWNIVWYVVAVSILVAFHEFGHFWVARRFGVKVLKFSIGFGRPIWQRTAKDGVVYQIGSIPLGGYVKPLDEREGEVSEEDRPRALNRQPVWARIAVYAAGPVFNFILAIAVYWLLLVVGIPGPKAIIAEPAALTAAARAGLHEGDRIIELGGRSTPTWSRVQTELMSRALDRGELPLRVEGRDGVQRQAVLDLDHVRIEPALLFQDVGFYPWAPPQVPVLGEIVAGSPAARAGLQTGDQVTAINGVAVDTFEAMVNQIHPRAGQPTQIDYLRDGVSRSVQVTPAPFAVAGQNIGRIGAASQLRPELQAKMRLGPLAALPEAFRETGQASVLTLRLIHRMLVGEVSVKNVSGPIQIAEVAGITASLGWVSFFGFLAAVSVGLGIFNLLPIPVLDGGQILYGLIEALKGSPLSERAQVIGQQLGLAILAVIIGFVLFNDISRQFG